MLNDFKKFILRGNVLDLAVAVIVGTAFNKIVTSLVNDILMPPLGLLLGKVNFKDLSFILHEASSSSPAVTLNYGVFIQTIVDFIIISASVFFIIKLYEHLQKKGEKEEEKPETPRQEVLLEEIRDILKKKK